MRRYRGLVPVLAVGLSFLAGSMPVHAATGPLVQSDAPPGFGTLHTKVYSSWVSKMKIVTHVKGMGKSTSSCKVLRAFRADGWTGGTIQTFNSPGLLEDFQLCANVFSAVSGAQRAYATAGGELAKQAAKVPALKPIPGATIGDESQGMFGAQSGFITAELIFRHGNALVLMVYIGGTRFSGAAFLQTAQRANARLP